MIPTGLTFRHEKIDNQFLDAKLDVRRRVMAGLNDPHPAVLETHAGHGVIRGEIYRDARRWLGIDEQVKGENILGSSQRVLRAIDIQPYNVFDVDAFGFPWEHVWLVSKRRAIAPGERIALAFTDGSTIPRHSTRPLRQWSKQMFSALGWSPKDIIGDATRGTEGHDRFGAIARRLVESWFNDHRVSLVTWVESFPSNRKISYYEALLEGRGSLNQ